MSAPRQGSTHREKTVPRLPLTLFTVGHSTRPIENFVDLLQAHGVRQIIDIRTVPRSRHNPQFNRESLPVSLKAARITYVHLAALGGLRHARKDSVNTGWRDASFRGFADYMQTADFQRGLEVLLRLAAKKPAALMCAEAVPWRCHRSLIADVLAVHGISVLHITSRAEPKPHHITPFAKVQGTQITYPQQGALDFAEGAVRSR